MKKPDFIIGPDIEVNGVADTERWPVSDDDWAKAVRLARWSLDPERPKDLDPNVWSTSAYRNSFVLGLKQQQGLHNTVLESYLHGLACAQMIADNPELATQLEAP